MTYLHINCGGKVDLIVGYEGCYDDNYGHCATCGMEGELIIKNTDEVRQATFVYIEPVTPRQELLSNDSA